MVNRDTLSPIVSTHASKRVHQSSVGKSCPLGQLDHVIANGHVVNIVRSDFLGVDLQHGKKGQDADRRISGALAESCSVHSRTSMTER